MEKELLNLIARLARASSRSRLYALRAGKDGRLALAAIFLALAESQAMQAQRFLMQVRGTVAATTENEDKFFTRELPASIEEFQELLRQAEQLGAKALATGFGHSAAVDRRSLELYATLPERSPDTDYYVCDFCGYIATDEPPEHCPVCTAPKKRFHKIASKP